MLELTQHGEASFVTLTYSNPWLPRMTANNIATLIPRDLQLFLKRFRKEMAPSKIRFFACGEYGDDNHRPHFHLALFNVPHCRYGQTRYRPNSKKTTCCDICDLLRDTWGKGRIQSDVFNIGTAQYIAGYVTKKMTAKDDYRLGGKHPEFARMSNRPGIGADAMHELASQLLKFNLDQTESDVPVTLAHGTRELPLGRYLRRKLRTLIGKDEKTPQEILDQMEAEMFSLRQTAFDASTSFKKSILDKFAGDRSAFQSRQRTFKQRRNL